MDDATREATEILVGLLRDIKNKNGVYRAELRVGEYPDGRRKYDIWTYPKEGE